MIVEVFRNNEWSVIQFAELQDGDKFRLKNPITGKFKKDELGAVEHIAIGTPYMGESEVLEIGITWDIV